MNNCELELEQWSPTQPCSVTKTGLIGDTIVMKCEQESEGLLLLKRVEIKQHGNCRSGKSSSPDTGYESDNFSRANGLGSCNLTLPTTPALLMHSTNMSAVSSLVEQELETQVIKIEDISVNLAEENAVLDLTTTNKNQSEYTHSPLDDTLSLADEIYAAKNMEVQSLTGVSVLKSVLESRPPIDTVLSCSDGKLGAHRIVLTAASKFFYELFMGQRLEEIVVVILPDITKKTMTILMHLAYTGQMIYTEDIQDDIFSAMECLLFGDVTKLSLFPIVTTITPTPPPMVEDIVSPNKTMTDMENIKPDVSEGKIGVQDSSVEIPTCSSSKSSTIKAKTNSVVLTCTHCPRTFTKKGSLQMHTTRCHPEECHASVGEMQMLSFCDICDRQYKTVSRAMFCYNQHGLTRCLTCLGVFPTTEIKEHYTTVHANVEGDDLVVKCRWCSRAVSVKNNCNNIASHSGVHWPGASSGKRQQEPTKVSKVRPKKTRTSETPPQKLTSLSFQEESTKISVNAFNQPAESKKRHRSSSSEDDFNLSKNLKTNKLQFAKRTGKPVGRGGGLTMEEATLHTVNKKHRVTYPVFEGHCEKSAKKVVLDMNNFPKLVIQLDSMENIKKMIKQNKNSTKNKLNKRSDEKKGKGKSNLGLSAAPGTGKADDSMGKISNNQQIREEVVKETTTLSSKEIKSSNLNFLTNSDMTNVNENFSNCKDMKILNNAFDKSQESLCKPDSSATKLSTYPMSYFPTRWNQAPMEDKTRKALSSISKESESYYQVETAVDGYATTESSLDGIL